MKRVLDVFFSLFGILLLSPLLIVISISIVIDSRGPIIFKQLRVGKRSVDFYIYKFRTMRIEAAKSGLLTIGRNDSRITTVGYFLRKFKLDELPQLFNVLIGQMSLVGPRPEVRKYVELYTESQMIVLNVRPGITDWASIEFKNENELLVGSSNPERFYIQTILPKKIELNLKYIRDPSLRNYLTIIGKTLGSIFV